MAWYSGVRTKPRFTEDPELSTGSIVGAEESITFATVGPFVRIQETGELCFLTVFGTFGVGIGTYVTLSATLGHGKKICGKVIAVWSTVVLVKITNECLPTSCKFVDVLEEDLARAGMGNPNLPPFEMGDILDARKLTVETGARSRVVMVSGGTMLTGRLQLHGLRVKTQDVYLGVIRRGVLLVEPDFNEPRLTVNCYGSAVFLLDNNTFLRCIGILVEDTIDNTAIVVPIHDVLEDLGHATGQTLAIETFQDRTLKRHDYAVDETLTDIKGRATDKVEALNSESMRILAGETQAVNSLKDNRATTSSIPKRGTATSTEDISHRLIQEKNEITVQQANVAEMLSSLETSFDKIMHIGVHQTALGGTARGEEEYNIHMRERTQLCREMLRQNMQTLDGDEYSDGVLPDYVPTMSTLPRDDELSLVEENVTPKTSDCLPKIRLLHAVDDTEMSKYLGKKDLMDSIELNKLCSGEGRNSAKVKKECNKICAAIKAESHQIVHVLPAYKLNDKATIIFVVFAERKITLHLPWTLEVRIVHQYSDESRIAMYSKENSSLSTETSGMIGDIIDNHSVNLMRNHTYLSAISASAVVSKHYGTTNHSIAPGPCIVLSVLVKHFIPINEEPFPTMLHEIPVDVREGGVRLCGGSADDFHSQVRMGCTITSTLLPEIYATLGGFVEHPEYGLCGFTCAHAILSDEWKLYVKGKGNVKRKELPPCEIYQPFYDPQNKIGRVVEVTFREGNADKTGVELALFKIEQRPPTEGNFPDNQGKAVPIKFESGRVWGKEGIPTHQSLVQKFGRATGLTCGQIQFDGAVVKEIKFHSKMEADNLNLTTTLYKQYHIKSNDINLKFSDLGDSGALVLMSDDFDKEGDLRCIGMVEGIWNDHTCAVTPITAILEELKVTQLKSFIPIITWKKIDARLREMEERIIEKIAKGSTNAQNPSQ